MVTRRVIATCTYNLFRSTNIHPYLHTTSSSTGSLVGGHLTLRSPVSGNSTGHPYSLLGLLSLSLIMLSFLIRLLALSGQQKH